MDTCEQVLGFFTPNEGPTHWFTAWITPDHLINCLPYGAVNGLPLNIFTYQEPYEGSSCVGIFTYHQNGLENQQREWIMVELLEPLSPGQEYFCSFRANAAFGGNAQYPQIWLASNNVGMLFSTINRQWVWGDPWPAYPNQAHIHYPEILSDTIGWNLVSGSFIADSAYQYVMIGNFFNNALTDTLHYAAPESVFPWYPRGYTLIDDVCVSADPNDCDLNTGMPVYGKRDLRLYPNPANEQITFEDEVGMGDWEVFDMLGRSMANGKITGFRNSIPTSNWPQGQYMLVVQRQEEVIVGKCNVMR